MLPFQSFFGKGLNIHWVKSVRVRSFCWSVFSCIWTAYGCLLSTFLYSVRMRESTNQKKLRIWTLSTLQEILREKKPRRNMRKKKEKKTYNALYVCCYYHQYQFSIDHCHSKYKQKRLELFMPMYVTVLV